MRHVIIGAALCLTMGIKGALAQAPTVVQPFVGSTHVGQYAAEFDQVTVMQGDRDLVEPLSVEGAVRTSLFVPPDGTSVLELRRSYVQALTDGGFDIMYDGPVTARAVRLATVGMLEELNAPRSTDPGSYRQIGAERVRRTDLQRIYRFPAHYVAAVRTRDGTRTLFSVILTGERGNMYLTEEVSAAARAQGTVTITEDGVNDALKDAGKAIIYGVQFDVGSAVIRPSSEASLDVLARVLTARPGRFYLVGHTSDTGSFEGNMALSADRARAIVEALGRQYGIDTSRLQPAGVGPVAPLASNLNEAGRQLNRRVELVERLDR